MIKLMSAALRKNPFEIGGAAPLGEIENPFKIGGAAPLGEIENPLDRKSTRLNSSHRR